jgi:hypothetical protein
MWYESCYIDSDHVPFPQELLKYGLTAELLDLTFDQVLHGERVPLQWSLNIVPIIEFFQALHQFMKRWSITRQATKTAIGRFYMAIDVNFSAEH